MNDIDLFDSWFRLADKDRDGLLSGAEAVEFYQRSGLSQDTLFKVWNLVAGDESALTKPQFYSTMRLISLAQQSGGMLQEAQARSMLIGVGPPVPPPRMAGLDQPSKPSSGPPQPSWQASSQGLQAVEQASAYSRFPPMAHEDAMRYQVMFNQMDGDRDGFVLGGDCFNAFMQWGLPKSILKDIWGAVAGDQGQLSQQQFVQCLYLMDNAKRGMPPPPQLPPGPFPPMAAPVGVPPSQHYAGGQQPRRSGDLNMASFTATDYTSQQQPVPDLPTKHRFQAPQLPIYQSRAPQLDEARLATLGPAERQRLEAERGLTQDLDQQLFKAQADQEIAKQKELFYNQALQELTLFKSKMRTSLLQHQERADKETAEADAMEKQYQAAYAGASATQSEGRALLASLQKAHARKQEATTKLAELQKDLEHLSSLSYDQVAEEDAETSQLQQEIAAAEAKKTAAEMRATAVREEKAELERELEALQLSVAAAEADVTNAQTGLRTLREKLRAEDRGSVTDLQTLLKSTATVYRNLVQHATAASIPIPPDALLQPERQGPGALDWDEFAAAGATDWEDFKDEGFKVVSALPNDSRYVSPASSYTSLNRSPSPVPDFDNLGGGLSGTKRVHSQSALSGKSSGFAADFGDTGASGLDKPFGSFEALASAKPGSGGSHTGSGALPDIAQSPAAPSSGWAAF